MQILSYPLINPYPIQDISESDLNHPILSVLHPNRRSLKANNAFEHACLVASGQSVQGLDMEAASVLQRSACYMGSLKADSLGGASMLEEYRNSYRTFEEADTEDLAVLAAANEELLAQGQYLAAGQTLFHGGSWPCSADGNPLSSFVSSRIISTTLMAGVAQWHADQHMPKELWVITVATGSPAKGFVFNPTGFLGHEFEVAIAAGAVFERSHETQFGDTSVVQVILR
jgi:hypothetical protein